MVTIIFVVIITFWAELFVPLKDWLKNLSGHHWTSKSIFSVVLYAAATAVLYLSLLQHDADRLRRSLGLLLVSTVLGTAALTLFYTAHHFQLF